MTTTTATATTTATTTITTAEHPSEHTTVTPRPYPSLPTGAKRLAFIGLGVMGGPMAAHLALAGHSVTVYNRTASKAEQWVSALSQKAPHSRLASASTPAQAAAGADMVFCCVGNDEDVRSVTLGEAGALAGMAAGAVLVDHTTASAQLARALYAQAQAQGVGFVDAPVSGGQAGAQNGQ